MADKSYTIKTLLNLNLEETLTWTNDNDWIEITSSYTHIKKLKHFH